MDIVSENTVLRGVY